MKVVINKCYGGFSLSDEGVRHYAKIKGLKLYPEASEYGLVTYFTVPPEERVKPICWRKATMEQRAAYNRQYDEQNIYSRAIPRDDDALVQVVEELGEDANGSHAELKVVEIPDGIEWEISEYDGMEHVEEKHRTWS